MDTGDYEMNLDAGLAAAGWDGLIAERDAARADGRTVGVGLSTYVEVCGFGPSGLVDLGFSWSEYQVPSAFNGSSLVRVEPDGSVTTSIGTGPSGQGHQTTWAQIVGDGLGIETDNIRVIHGDTTQAPISIGSFGSRSAAVDGAACYEATQKVRAKAAKIAAHLLEASEDDIEFADGAAHVAGSPDSSVSWGQESPRLRISRTPCRKAWRVASRRTRSSARATPRGHSARTLRWSRSIRTPVTSTCSSTSPWTTAATSSTR